MKERKKRRRSVLDMEMPPSDGKYRFFTFPKGFIANNKKMKERKRKKRRPDLGSMKMLKSNDEAFHLSDTEIEEIIDIIHSRKTPDSKTCMQWDEYVKSFYLKMCICFDADFQDLESTPSEDEDEEEVVEEQKESCVMSLSRMAELKRLEDSLIAKDEDSGEEEHCGLDRLDGPMEFGSYSTKPKLIPYHLYLLVREAVYNIKHNHDLTIVEEKISFFCNIFRSHLPAGWNYTRDKASSLISNYDTTKKPTDLMSGFTPFEKEQLTSLEIDDMTDLSPLGAAQLMTMFYSRITPSFWRMSVEILSFYCKLCSCFGIKEYHRLEDASEDDVCLMKVGLEPSGLFGVRSYR